MKITKYALIVLFLGVTTLSLNAQKLRGSAISTYKSDSGNKWNVFYGMSLATYGGDDANDDIEFQSHFVNAGFSYWITSVPNVIIEPGLRVISKGGYLEYKYSDWGYTYKEEYSDWLLVQEIFCKVKANVSEIPVPVHPYAGFALGLMLPLVDDLIWSEYLNLVEFSLLFGVDYVLFDRMTLGFEYNLGLTSIIDYSDWGVNDIAIKNRTMLFSIGYLF